MLNQPKLFTIVSSYRAGDGRGFSNFLVIIIPESQEGESDVLQRK